MFKSKRLYLSVLAALCLAAPPQKAAASGAELVELILSDPRVFELFVEGSVVVAYGAYKLFVPLDWMEPGTVSGQFALATNDRMEGDGSIWPLGFGLVPPLHYPNEEAGVALADIGVVAAGHANVYGVQVGGLAAVTYCNCFGVGVGGLMANAVSIYGIQVGGLLANSYSNFYGIQVGGLLASNHSDLYGMQIAGYANDVPGTCYGMQAGTVNMAKSVVGMQVGFTNYAQDLYGMQIGVVNVADSLGGFQLGLVNVIRENGVFPASPILNMGF